MKPNDYEPVIWRKASKQIIGGIKETKKKFDNSKSTKYLKLDDSTCSEKVPDISTSFRIALQKARSVKGWSQKDLANRLNIKVTLVQLYEKGNIPRPDRGLVARMSKVLGVTLPSVVNKSE